MWPHPIVMIEDSLFHWSRDVVQFVVYEKYLYFETFFTWLLSQNIWLSFVKISAFFIFFVFLQSTDDTLKFPICQILIHLMKNLLDMLVYCITIGSDGEAIEWRRLSNRGYIANFVQDFLNLIFEWLDEFGSSWFYHLSDRIYPHFHQNNGKCRSFLIWQQLTWANAH